MNGRLARLKQKRRFLIAAAVLAGVILLVLLLSFWQGWLWFREPVYPGQADQPGAATGLSDEWVVEEHEIDLLEQRMVTLLDQQGLLVSWYRLAGRTGIPAAVQSGEKKALDQLLYGQYLLEQRRENDFNAWWQTFSTTFATSDGVVSRIPGEPSWLADLGDEPGRAADDSWRVNLLTARLLAQSCAIWPDRERLDWVIALSDRLLGRLEQQPPVDFEMVRPTPVPILDPGATPTPKPDASTGTTPDPDPETGSSSDSGDGMVNPQETVQAIRLASLDLLAARQLAAIDDRWLGIYEQWLSWIEGGYLGDDLPLHAWAVEIKAGTDESAYLPFAGSVAAVQTGEAFLTLLHLAEVGQLRAESLLWLKNQLYNQNKIDESYHIVQGTPMTGNESIAACALIARIARIQLDQPLYELAVERLLWHQATNAKSAALSTLFRQNDTDMITVFARDNLLGMLAMR